ncbi:MAG TPA: UXX-star (seleno)protein family 1 [Anaeromyxobacter sp.]
MADAVQIYGKDTCPYTSAARADYGARGVQVEYHDVKRDPEAMKRFLALSGGDRRVPLIVEGGRVTVGYGGS